jgi:hypothetical protein
MVKLGQGIRAQQRKSNERTWAPYEHLAGCTFQLTKTSVLSRSIPNANWQLVQSGARDRRLRLTRHDRAFRLTGVPSHGLNGLPFAPASFCRGCGHTRRWPWFLIVAGPWRNYARTAGGNGDPTAEQSKYADELVTGRIANARFTRLGADELRLGKWRKCCLYSLAPRAAAYATRPITWNFGAIVALDVPTCLCVFRFQIWRRE